MSQARSSASCGTDPSQNQPQPSTECSVLNDGNESDVTGMVKGKKRAASTTVRAAAEGKQDAAGNASDESDVAAPVVPTADSATALQPAKTQTPVDPLSIRALFSDYLEGWPEDKIVEFEIYMNSPCNVEPFPSEVQIGVSHLRTYYYGFYMTDPDFRRFARKHNPNYRKSPTPTMADYDFTVQALSLVMNRVVFVRFAYVSEEHKENCPKLEVDVGDTVLIIGLLSSLDYRMGYRPSNGQVREIQQHLKRKPFWWEAAEESLQTQITATFL